MKKNLGVRGLVFGLVGIECGVEDACIGSHAQLLQAWVVT